MILRGQKANVRIASEKAARQGNAVTDDFSHGEATLIGRPTVRALRVLGRANGFTMDGLSDWDGLLRDNPDADHFRDYLTGTRATARYTCSDDA